MDWQLFRVSDISYANKSSKNVNNDHRFFMGYDQSCLEPRCHSVKGTEDSSMFWTAICCDS
jgi:hypothetical protein